jgi:hypothetical protein
MFFSGFLFLSTDGSGGFTASGAFARSADLAPVLAVDRSGGADDHDFAPQEQGLWIMPAIVLARD